MEELEELEEMEEAERPLVAAKKEGGTESQAAGAPEPPTRAVVARAALDALLEQGPVPAEETVERFVAAVDVFFEKPGGDATKRLKYLDAKSWAELRQTLGERLARAAASDKLGAYLAAIESVVRDPVRQSQVYVLVESLQWARDKSQAEVPAAVSDKALSLAESLFQERTEALEAGRMEALDRALAARVTTKLAHAFGTRVRDEVVQRYVVLRAKDLKRRVDKLAQKALRRNPSVKKVVLELAALQKEYEITHELGLLVETAVRIGQHTAVKELIPLDSSKELARTFIRTLLEAPDRNLKVAHACMCEHKLYAEFPDLTRRYRHSALRSALRRNRHAEVVYRLQRYGDDELSRSLIEEVTAAGEHWTAVEMAKRLGRNSLEDPLLASVDRAEYEVQCQDRHENVLAFPLDLDADVTFVDDEASAKRLTTAFDGLGAGAVVGLDAEWKPTFSGKSSHASVLQIALREHVFIVDLLWLKKGAAESNAAALAVLASTRAMFVQPGVYKLGFAFEGDMRVLSSSFPDEDCWSEVAPLVDFANLHCSAPSGPSAEARWEVVRKRRSAGGLKDLVAKVLGKELNKLSQMSDWEQRPLSPEQLSYAVIDAYSLVMCFDVLFKHRGAAEIASISITALHQRQKNQSAGGAAPQVCEAKPESIQAIRDALHARCAEKGIQFEPEATLNEIRPTCDVAIVNKAVRCTSVRATAEQLGMERSCVLKSMAYMMDGLALDSEDPVSLPVVVVVRGDCSVKEDKVEQMAGAKLAGVARLTRLRRASAKECVALLGAEPGTIGPFSARGDPLVVMDTAALDTEPSCSGPVVCGSGSHEHLLFARSPKILRGLCGASVGAVGSKPRTNAATQAPQSRLTSGGERTGELSFMADDMLGRVGKMLRMVGFDCLYLSDLEQGDAGVGGSVSASPPDAPVSPNAAEKLEEKRRRSVARASIVEEAIRVARTQQRVLLTTDRKLVSRAADVEVCVLDNFSGRRAQFQELCERYSIKLQPSDFLSRCVKCNSKGYEMLDSQQISELKAEGKVTGEEVPDGIVRDMNTFYRCTKATCRAIYWEGPKFDRCVETYQFLFAPDQAAAAGSNGSA